MPLHVDENGVGVVTPDYLYHPNGTVPHPLQRTGAIDHMPHGDGTITGFFDGHGFIGDDRTVAKTPGQR